jgi:hypothetical protein
MLPVKLDERSSDSYSDNAASCSEQLATSNRAKLATAIRTAAQARELLMTNPLRGLPLALRSLDYA